MLEERDNLGRFKKGFIPKTAFKKGNSAPKTAFKRGNIPHNRGVKGIIRQSEEIKIKRGLYRSGKDSRSYKGGKPKCIDCGKQLSNYDGKRCRKCHFKTKTGKNNNWWKGGVTPKIKLLRESLEYKVWKLEIYKKDKGICRLCGIRCNDKTIVAHHLNNFNDFPELRFSINNGITLCRSCHTRLHHK